MHKSAAVQAALLDNPRKAKEVAVIQLLGCGSPRYNVEVKSHGCTSYFDGEDMKSKSINAVSKAASEVLELLGEEDFDQFHWCDVFELYECIKLLTDAQLDKVHLFLTTLSFGQCGVAVLDTDENSLFNLIAHDLDVDMNKVWYADEFFLSKHNKAQLCEIIEETHTRGLFGKPENWKKGEIVKSLADFFAESFEAQSPTHEQEMARGWMPKAFKFPAVDPDLKS